MTGTGAAASPARAPEFRGRADAISWRLAVVLSSIAFFLLAGVYAWTRPPVCDEAFYASPGIQLHEKGTMGSPLLESPGLLKFTRIEQNTYWTMPGMTLIQAAWYKVFGTSLHSIRGISVLSGLVVVLAWAYLYSHLADNRTVAILATLLLAFDYSLLNVASVGRSDSLSFAFAAPALAVYCHFRNRNLFLALFLSNLLAAFAGMTHPIAGIATVVGLGVLFFALDRQELEWRHAAALALPYLMVGAAWLGYLMQDLEAFRAQFFGNLGDRFERPSGANLVIAEAKRYLSAYGFGDGLNAAHRIRLVQFGLVLVGFGLLVAQRLRSGVNRVVVGLGLAWMAVLFLFEGSRQSWYVVVLSPIAAWSVAAGLDWIHERRGKIPALVAGALVVLTTGVSVGGGAWLNHYKHRFGAITTYLQERVQPNELIMGAGEIAFAVNFKNYIDDREFGRASGKRPDWIVFPDWDVAYMRASKPDQYRYLETMLATDFEAVYRQGPYQIWRRTRRGGGTSAN